MSEIEEIILLVEPVGLNNNGRMRPMLVKASARVTRVIERERGPLGDIIGTRLWECLDDERALTGQRIFREPVARPIEEREDPVFMEYEVKEPLPFTDAETPGGFSRKHLKKES